MNKIEPELRSDGTVAFPPLKKGECDITIKEPITPYTKIALEYAEVYSVNLAPTLKDAFNERMQNKRTLTKRELDIAARMKINLGDSIFWQAMFEFGGHLFEGTYPWKKSPFYFRDIYNKTLKIIDDKALMSKQTQVNKIKIEAALRNAKTKLEEFGLPLWGHEVKDGLHPLLLKPEFMTWEQWKKRKHVGVYSPKEKKIVKP